MNPLFLALDEVLSLHAEQIRLFGGSSGIRDVGLLQSAIGSVEATFAGAFLHETLFAMAAAYLYGICSNHPFIDGDHCLQRHSIEPITRSPDGPA